MYYSSQFLYNFCRPCSSWPYHKVSQSTHIPLKETKPVNSGIPGNVKCFLLTADFFLDHLHLLKILSFITFSNSISAKQ